MKKLLLILFIGTLPLVASAQRPTPIESDPVSKTLILAMTELTKGVFVRLLEQYNPYEKARAAQQNSSNEDKETIDQSDVDETMYITRFDLPLYTTRTTLLGRVFVGNRYYSKAFVAYYEPPNQFQTDQDGFFYLYKLFILRNELISGQPQFGVYIYPNLVTNLCRKGMHGNKKPCTSPDDHLAALIDVAHSIKEDTRNLATIRNEYKTFLVRWSADTVDRIVMAYTKYAFSTDHSSQTSYALQHYTNPHLTGSRAITRDLISRNTFRQSPRGAQDAPADQDSLPVVAMSARTTATIPPGFGDLPDGAEPPDLTTPTAGPDAPPAVQEGWLYAGIVRKSKKGLTWYKQFVEMNLQLPDGDQTAKPLLNMNLRNRAPQNDGSEWIKGEKTRTYEKGTELRVLERQYVPYDSELRDLELLWLRVEPKKTDTPQN